MEEVPTTKGGRPRNADADRRILEAALTIYGEEGWHGFNLTKIAAAAKVGKSSMYTRWPHREDLFLDAFRTLIPIEAPTGETPYEILTNEASFRMRLYVGPWAVPIRRVFVEMTKAEHPVIRVAYEHIFLNQLGALRERLWEFKNEGVLVPGTSITRLLDAVEGSILMRAFCLAHENIPCFLTEIEEYADNLVRDQLFGADPRRGLRAVS